MIGKIFSFYSLLKIKRREMLFALVIMLFLTSGSFVQPLIIKKIIDSGIVGCDFLIVVRGAVAILVISIIYQLCNIILVRHVANINNQIIDKIYTLISHKITTIKMDYFDEIAVSEFSDMICTDVSKISAVTDQMGTAALQSCFLVVGGILGLIYLNPYAAIAFTIFIPIKYLIVIYFANHKTSEYTKELDWQRKIAVCLGEMIQGIKDIRIFGGNLGIRLSESSRGFQDTHKENNVLDQRYTSTLSMIDVVIECGLYIGCGALSLGGTFSIGNAMAFINYGEQTFLPINNIVQFRYFISGILPSIDRLTYFLNYEDSEQYIEIKERKSDNDPFLTINSVNFKYGEHCIFEDLNLTIRHGEKIVITGKNGSGKSTLIDIISGLKAPDSGKIIMTTERENNENNHYKLQDFISVVFQNSYLFKNDIKDNIFMGQKYEKNEFEKICDDTSVSGLIKNNKGTNISGGEKKRVLISRAIIKDVEFLIFDETFAEVDKQIRVRIIDLLFSSRFKDKTIIFVTHSIENYIGKDYVHYDIAGRTLRLIIDSPN